MLVYILEGHIDYEGGAVLGVFTTPEKAADACPAKSGKNLSKWEVRIGLPGTDARGGFFIRRPDDEPYYDCYSINEYKVDEVDKK